MIVAEPNMSVPRRMRLAALATVLAAALTALGACASPEKGESPGADKPFPKLATVPDKPEGETRRQRMQIQEGLFADRRNARYLEGGGPRAGYGGAPDKVTDSDVRAEIFRPGSARQEAKVRTVDGVRLRALRLHRRGRIPRQGHRAAAGQRPQDRAHRAGPRTC